MPLREATPFHVHSVPLRGSNLIEASAGTGKTYSIAILALRLVLEGTSVKEMLMVTFTKAAVAELESRIRDFIRLAAGYSEGIPVEDTLIARLVDEAVQQSGADTVRQRLRDALLLLDETTIATIHGFCQRVLTEYAFETGQVFGATAMTELDSNQLLEEGINRFWRKHVTTLDDALLELLRSAPANLTRASIRDRVRQRLGGRKPVAEDTLPADFLSPAHQQAVLDGIRQPFADVQAGWEAMCQELEANRQQLVERMQADKNATRHLAEHINGFSAPAFLDYLKSKSAKPAQYLSRLFPAELERIVQLQHQEELAGVAIFTLLSQLYQYASSQIIGELVQQKEAKSLISFDDMIIRVHDAVVRRRHAGLIGSLRKQFRAVFIDEFQDTDKLQYEVFSTLFNGHALLFYIGDPKQSIYAFRKADIFTYFAAVRAVDNLYSMNTNYRSSGPVIAALNKFFLPVPGFDTFFFGDSDEGIRYIPVDPPVGSSKGELWFDGRPAIPLQFHEAGSKDELAAAAVARILELLRDARYSLPDKGEGRRPLRPSDFGVLVRSKDEGMKVKTQLARYRVPAVTIDETRILQTEMARELTAVLEGVLRITAAGINKALLTQLTGKKLDDLQGLDEMRLLEQFREYQRSWEAEGIYVMLMRFFADQGVRGYLLSGDAPNGERHLSNLIQLTELLHKTEKNQRFSPLELFNWLRKGIDNGDALGDEYEQRIESDEDAVKIVTIHRSKGLEYNIVIAPYLDLTVKQDVPLLTFRDPRDGDYYFVSNQLATDEQKAFYACDNEQENRRLLYVALTRARYACLVFRNTYRLYAESTLSQFWKALNGDRTGWAALGITEVNDIPEIPAGYRYNGAAPEHPLVYEKADPFTLLQPNWRRLSYTGLNPDHTVTRAPLASGTEDPYDDFVFNRLRKGAFTGTLLHSIFERIDYSDPTRWPAVVSKALQRLSAAGEDGFPEQLVRMLQVITSLELEAPDGSRFPLSAISRDRRLTELEFDFPVSPFNTRDLEALGDASVPLRAIAANELEGIMNGKIDLVFEQQGRFYILDWKSNYLGGRPEDYTGERLDLAMEENNYHLQYLIYTVALCKYLALRKPDFDYERDFGGVAYVFIRGVREGQQTGLYFTRPPKEWVDKMIAVLQAATAGAVRA